MTATCLPFVTEGSISFACMNLNLQPVLSCISRRLHPSLPMVGPISSWGTSTIFDSQPASKDRPLMAKRSPISFSASSTLLPEIVMVTNCSLSVCLMWISAAEAARIALMASPPLPMSAPLCTAGMVSTLVRTIVRKLPAGIGIRGNGEGIGSGPFSSHFDFFLGRSPPLLSANPPPSFHEEAPSSAIPVPLVLVWRCPPVPTAPHRRMPPPKNLKMA
mmetsp:Transcript_12860/g.36581  ORF Transcript_12860/g.36581 Transcript_12860/m.36581 type:complete len:218 (-) Transcript_12860:3-656(-)